jgi:hypothetical protein
MKDVHKMIYKVFVSLFNCSIKNQQNIQLHPRMNILVILAVLQAYKNYNFTHFLKKTLSL